MFTRISLAVALLAGLTVAGCQQPNDGSDALQSERPSGPVGSGGGATPIAPAIEPRPTGPDPTIELPEGLELPSSEPVAPAIEDEPGVDPTIDVDPG